MASGIPLEIGVLASGIGDVDREKHSKNIEILDRERDIQQRETDKRGRNDRQKRQRNGRESERERNLEGRPSALSSRWPGASVQHATRVRAPGVIGRVKASAFALRRPRVGGGAASVQRELCCCCCCSYINSDYQVRRHKTDSSHSGAEEYPREKTQTSQK